MAASSRPAPAAAAAAGAALPAAGATAALGPSTSWASGQVITGDLRQRLTLGKSLGSGAYAVVYRAVLDGKACAVKVLLPQHSNSPRPHREDCAVRMFLREGELLQRLEHGHITRCSAILELPPTFPGLLRGYVRNTWALVLELLEGGTLSSLMHKQMLAPWKFLYDNSIALEWSAQVASALAHLHGGSPSVIHRDVKLDNVLLCSPLKAGSRPPIKLVDLGLHTCPRSLARTTRQTLLRARMSSNGGGSINIRQSVEHSSNAFAAAAAAALAACDSHPAAAAPTVPGGRGASAAGVARVSMDRAGSAHPVAEEAVFFALPGDGSMTPCPVDMHDLASNQNLNQPLQVIKPPPSPPCTVASPDMPRLPEEEEVDAGGGVGACECECAACTPGGGSPGGSPRRCTAVRMDDGGAAAGGRLLCESRDSLAHRCLTQDDFVQQDGSSCSVLAQHHQQPVQPAQQQHQSGANAAAATAAGADHPSSGGLSERDPSGVMSVDLLPFVSVQRPGAGRAGWTGKDGPASQDGQAGALAGRQQLAAMRKAPHGPHRSAHLLYARTSSKIQPSPDCSAHTAPLGGCGPRAAASGGLSPSPVVPRVNCLSASATVAASDREAARSAGAVLLDGRLTECSEGGACAGAGSARELSRRITAREVSVDELEVVYRLTGETGSAMAMAPEIWMKQPYNDKVDCYAFGVLMFELWSRNMLAVSHIGTRRNDLPRTLNTCEEFADLVSSGYRPAQPASIPDPIWDVICDCWHQDPLLRPSMAAVELRLRTMLEEQWPDVVGDARKGPARSTTKGTTGAGHLPSAATTPRQPQLLDSTSTTHMSYGATGAQAGGGGGAGAVQGHAGCGCVIC